MLTIRQLAALLSAALWLYAVNPKGNVGTFGILLRASAGVGIVVGCLGLFSVGKRIVALEKKRPAEHHA